MGILKNAALAAATVVAGAGAAWAEYPESPITLIVPWSAGGGTDATGRLIAGQLEETLGQPVNVVNRTGGGGIVGHTALAEAEPDGYTLGIITTELSMYSAVGSAELTYEDYSLVGLYNADPSAIFVKADSEFETVEDLAEAIKADVSALSTSGANFGGLNHLSWISLVQGLGGEASAVNWVPTDGGAPSLQLLVSGAIDVVVAQFPEAKALIEAGEIRPLAYLGSEPNEGFPDVPTVNDALGVDFAIAGWRGLAGPAGLPDDITATLVEALDGIVQSEPFNEAMGNLNYGVVWEGGDDFMEYLAQRGKAFGDAISSAGLDNQ
ncbi:tripartite tricarboxylate transporter substrate binding protein [Psychromarinibacter halotolerans]|uniref:Tripartite tricarboxylate transporter substrate binding protein n=1 Tax=Psychromarinibacter halotolerans TaxID=1775175 RepID=A0ABV7GV41_9RHOB|nr:tripartite tricarboxylate transporter substrate binding protein [Psychromarinibacter halotolerans]MDF0596256.1 tripartite tricarboxylate transporter substrate binding protein [Psychromarinibacter halotolerans]